MKKNNYPLLIALIFTLLGNVLSAQTLVNLAYHDTSGNPNLTIPFMISVKLDTNEVMVLGSQYNTSTGTSVMLTLYNSVGPVIQGQATMFTTPAVEVVSFMAAYATPHYIYLTALVEILDTPGIFSATAVVKLSIDSFFTADSLATVWTNFYNFSANPQVPAAITSDGENIYVAGTDIVDSNTSAMFLMKIDSAGDLLYNVSYDTAGMITGAAAMSLYASAAPSVVVTGFSGSGYGAWDFVTAYFDPGSGTLQSADWAANGDGSFSSPAGVVKDSIGRIIIAGTAAVSGSNTDIKIIGYDTLFAQRFLSTWGNADSLADSASVLREDLYSNLLITGYTTSTGHVKQLLVLRYNDNDSLLWSRIVPAPNPAYDFVGTDITSDDNLNVYVCGRAYDGSNWDYVTLAYDPNGNILWQKMYGTNGNNDIPWSIVVDSSGDVVVSGISYNDTTGTFLTLEYSQATAFLPADSINANGPFAFYENRGQLYSSDTLHGADSIFYYTSAGNLQLFVAGGRLSYVAGYNSNSSARDSVQRFDMQLMHAGAAGPVPEYIAKSGVYPAGAANAHQNFYLGYMKSPAVNVIGYDRLVEKNVYTGIDWQICSAVQGIKNYFVIYPGSDPTQIDMQFNGQDSIDTSGNALKLFYRASYLQLDTLIAYTVDSSGDTSMIRVGYHALADNGFGISLGSYDNSATLIIENNESQGRGSSSTDWSTFWGGSQKNEGIGVTTDAQGYAYLCAMTNSLDFPNIVGEQQTDSDHVNCTVVASFDANGAPRGATYFGGSFWDVPTTIALNSQGDIYVGGYTESTDMPLRPLNNSSINGNGSVVIENPPFYQGDGYIAEFSNDLSQLLFSRYFGGFWDDVITGLAIDNSNNIYVVGITQSDTSFPITAKSGAYDQSLTTAVGGDESSIDGFIAELNSSNSLIWCTYFGGSGEDQLEHVTVAPNGHIFIAGHTSSTLTATNDPLNTGPACGVPSTPNDFPTCNPGSGAFYQGNNNAGIGNANEALVELDTSGGLLWSTLFGGNGSQGTPPLGQVYPSGSPLIIAVNPNNASQIYLAGTVECVNGGGPYTFPSMYSGSQYGQDSLESDAAITYIAEFSNRQQVWSTTFGNNSMPFTNMVEDGLGNVYITGYTLGNNTYSGTSCAPSPSPLEVVPNCNPGEGIYYQSSFGGGGGDAYIAAFNPSNELIWSTFYGGDSYEQPWGLAYDPIYSRLYITGNTNSDSAGFPLLNPGTGNYMQTSPTLDPSQLQSGFIARFHIPFGATAIQEVKPNVAGILKVYPDPASQYVNIVTPADVTGSFALQIYDETGKMVYSASNFFAPGIVTVNIANFAAGFYYINLFNQVENMRAKLVIEK